MNYPFYLGENLTTAAIAHDRTAFLNLATRNFEAVIGESSQPATIKKLRIVQLSAVILRAIYRAGAYPDGLQRVTFEFLDNISKVPAKKKEVLKSTLLDFCVEALKQVPRVPSRPSNLLERFLALVDEEKGASLSVEDCARKLRVSPSFLWRAVKFAAGRTPSEFIRLKRLNRAREQLAERSVREVACGSGFKNVSAFISAYRKHFGETPGSYRRRLLHGR